MTTNLEEITFVSYDSFYIGGRWVAPSSDRVIEPVDASTEQPLGRVPAGAEPDIDAAVAAARAAFDSPTGWSNWEPARRAEVMDRLADAIDRRAEDFVALVGAQNGMPDAVARQLEIGYPSMILRYYTGWRESCPIPRSGKDCSVVRSRSGEFRSAWSRPWCRGMCRKR